MWVEFLGGLYSKLELVVRFRLTEHRTLNFGHDKAVIG